MQDRNDVTSKWRTDRVLVSTAAGVRTHIKTNHFNSQVSTCAVGIYTYKY